MAKRMQVYPPARLAKAAFMMAEALDEMAAAFEGMQTLGILPEQCQNIASNISIPLTSAMKQFERVASRGQNATRSKK
jgi:hypothetical protein